jgi:hypothetical protein
MYISTCHHHLYNEFVFKKDSYSENLPSWLKIEPRSLWSRVSYQCATPHMKLIVLYILYLNTSILIIYYKRININIYESFKNIPPPFVIEPIFVNAIYMHIKVKNFT